MLKQSGLPGARPLQRALPENKIEADFCSAHEGKMSLQNDKGVIVGVTLIVLSGVFIVALFLVSLLFFLLGLNIGGKSGRPSEWM